TTAFLDAFTTVGPVHETDVVGLVVPFTHLYGTAILSHALSAGATVVTWNALGFDLEAFLRMLQDHAVTVAPVTPPVVLALARSPTGSICAPFDRSFPAPRRARPGSRTRSRPAWAARSSTRSARRRPGAMRRPPTRPCGARSGRSARTWRRSSLSHAPAPGWA